MSSKLIHGDHKDVSFSSFPQTYLLLQSPCLFEVQFDVPFLKWILRHTSRARDVIRNLPSGRYV